MGHNGKTPGPGLKESLSCSSTLHLKSVASFIQMIRKLEDV